MRAVAQYTGGRYAFLTDDSGVGNAHEEAHVPCYYVSKLDDVVLRVVDVELSGADVPPPPETILRSVGEPVDGVCQLPPDATANAF